MGYRIDKIQKESEVKLRRQEYSQLIKNDLTWKINHSKEKIKEYLKIVNKDKYTVAFSGGKDSTALLELLLEYGIKPEKIILYIANELFYSEIKENINYYKNKYQWGGIIEYDANIPFVNFIEKYGLFYSSKEIIRNIITYGRYYKKKENGDDISKYKKIDNLKKKIYSVKKNGELCDKYLRGEIKLTDQCCANIKNSKKVSSDFVGLRATEGNQRLNGWIKTGCNDFTNTKSKPISLWTDKDVFSYLESKNWKIPEVYKYVNRTGCILCPFGWRRKQKFLYEKYPNAYNLGWKLFKQIFDHFEVPYLGDPLKN